jgi:DNA-binding LytR/AlgR family response regulator
MPSSSPLQCLVVDDDAVSRTVIEKYVDRSTGLDLTASCEDATEAATVLQDDGADIIFLDVEMPGMSGLDLMESLRDPPHVVLVTAKEEYAVEAFDLEAIDYLVKPVEYPRFLKAVDRVRRRIDEDDEAPDEETGEVEGDYVFVKVDGRLRKVELPDIRWIEAEGDYVMIHTSDDRHLVHSTMKNMERKLPSEEFARVHRSYIVRLERVDDIGDRALLLDRKRIPIGASYRDDLLDRLQTL